MYPSRPLVPLLAALPFVAAGAWLGAGAAPAAAQERRGGLDRDRLVELLEEHVAAQETRRREVRNPPRDAAERATQERIRRLLDERKVTVAFHETPVEEAMDFLRDVTGLNVVISKKASEALEGRSVSLRLRDLTLRSCLELILQLAHDDLRYGVRLGVLWLGLKEEWPRRTVLRTYDVSDITHRPPDFPGPRLGLGGVIEHD